MPVEVILRDDVPNLGRIGEIVRVKPGYARNYLLPRGLAIEANRKNPMLAMMYGFSIEGCLASATSGPGGAGYGTLGLPPSVMEDLCRSAGFTRFQVHDFDDPANLYYEVRP